MPREQPPLIQTAGVLLILGTMVLRVTSSFDPFPGWSGDPFRLPSPILGITPALSLGLDLLTLIGAGLALSRARAAISTWVLLGLTAAGAASVAWHARATQPDALDHLITGSAWIAAMIGAVAVRHAAASPFIRRIVVGCVLGVLPVLVLKALVQVYIDHPDTVREYERSKREFLESQGWTVGSPMAMAYERRLMQAEGSGWFGLANVYASLVATGFVACTGLAWAAWRSRERAATVVLSVAAVASGIGVLLAGSKGGFAAAGIGFILLLILAVARRLGPTAGGVLSALVVLGSLAAVMVRGYIGERLGELSILFRWFYMQGAARVFAEHPVWGVGPAGFKDAYMRLKNPLSPEDVVSPHSILLDYAATLGLGGLCLGVAWFILVVRAGANATAPQPTTDEAGSARAETRLAAAIGAFGIIAAAWLEQPISTIESTLMRLTGVAAFAGVAWSAAQVMRGSAAGAVNTALAAAALALAAHCQIEMTPITTAAALWVMLSLAMAGPSVPDADDDVPTPAAWNPAAAVPLAACGVLVIGALPAWRWESNLRAAYDLAVPIAEFNQRAQLVFGGRPQGDSAAAIARELGEILGETLLPSGPSIAPALDRLRRRVMPDALAQVRLANQAQPGHFPTSRALARLCLLSAEAATDAAERHKMLDDALAVSHAGAQRWGGGSSAWAWLATTQEAAGRIDSSRADLKAIIIALQHASELAPYEPSYQVKLALAYEALSTTEKDLEIFRFRAASRALELDRAMRLDPLRRLSDSEREDMERLIGRSGR